MRIKIKILKVLIALLIIGLPAAAAMAQTVVVSGPYRVEKGSKIWIEGSTSVSEFTCTSDEVDGYGHFSDDSLRTERTSLSVGKKQPNVRVSLPDHSLDCGKRQMNHDMYNALKAEKFPVIHYHLDNAQILATTDSTSGWFKVDTFGKLTIAGKTNNVKMMVDGRLLPNGRFHVKGSKELSMSEFNINPPSPFWGLIKTHDKITVNFDLYVAPEKIRGN